MASLTKEKNGYRCRVYVSRKRRSLWIGDVPKRIADGVAYNVDKLVQAREAGQEPDAATTKWVASLLEGRIKERLIAWGLVDEDAVSRPLDDPLRKLAPFIDRYICDRTDLKPATIAKYRYVGGYLVDYFGADKTLKSITAADAQRFKRFLLKREVRPATDTQPAKTMAEATVSKAVKRAKTMFQEAVRDRLLTESPFAGVKGGAEVNPSRQHFIDRQVAKAVLDACPDHNWRMIFALARYGGLRCPTEVCGLKWDDVLWDKERIRIDSVKTGLRFSPIFPELKPLLGKAYDDAPEGAVYVAGPYGGTANRNLATRMKRIIESAGEKPWPKMFVNLRASRRTELQEAFPSHVVDEWLGHSTEVAKAHYLQVTNDHWSAGASKVTGNQIGGPTGGPISVNPLQSAAIVENKKRGKTRV